MLTLTLTELPLLGLVHPFLSNQLFTPPLRLPACPNPLTPLPVVSPSACPTSLSLASLLLADPVIGSLLILLILLSPKENYPEFLLLAAPTLHLSFASFHRLLLSTSTLCFVQRTKPLRLQVWLSSASALLVTPQRIVCIVSFWWCHFCMVTCNESNGFWWICCALDAAATGCTNAKLQLKIGFVSIQFWKSRINVRYQLRYSALEGHMWA